MSDYGLNPANFAQGAMNGYSFMEGIYSRRDAAKRQTERDAEGDRRYGIADARAQESHDSTMRANQRAEDNAIGKQGYAAMQAGLDTPEGMFEVMYKNGLVPGEMMDQADRELKVAENIMKSGKISAFSHGDGLASINGRLKYDLNSDSKGVPLPGNRQITGIYPGQEPGTAVFDLSGEYEDGTPFSNQPMTKGRGTAADGDDVVLQQHIGAIAKKLQGQRIMINAYKNDPEFKAKFDKYAEAMGWTSKEKPIKVSINDRLVDPTTNKVLLDADPAAKGGGSTPKDIQTAEWLVRSKIAKTPEEAWNMLKTASSDPVNGVTKIAELLAAAQESARMRPEDEGYRSTQQLLADAEEMVTGIRQRSTVGKRADTAAPAPKQAGAAPMELPAPAMQQLKPGKVTTFKNGQKWTIENGKAVRVE